MPSPTAPTKLGAKSRRLWRWATSTYELRGDELRLLEDACREVDLIERLEKELARGDLVVAGSMGQPVTNPLLQELRQHRLVLRSLLGALHLPDEESTPAASSRSSSAREAANARWRRGA